MLTSRVLLLIVAGLMILSYCAAIVNPAKAWLMEIFGLMFLPLFVLNLFLLLWAIIRRSRAFLIPFLALLPAFFCLNRFVQFSSDTGYPELVDDSGKNREVVRFISYNVGRFVPDARHDIPTREACMDSVITFLNDSDADIICLQEFYVKDKSSLKAFLKRHFPKYHSEYYMFTGKYGNYGNVTLSRYPIIGKGVVKFENSANLALYSDVQAGGDEFRVYNCHFESYNVSIPGVVEKLGRDKNILKETSDKMKGSIMRRPKQVDKVLSDIENCGKATIVCGDFNDTPMSYTYNRLVRGRKDCFVDAGQGMGATYSVLWPLLRIDYVLVPDHMLPLSYMTFKKHYSDHHPLVTQFAI